MAASSAGNDAELIQALTVMLPVSWSGAGFPRSTKSFEPSRKADSPLCPTPQPAPFVSAPVMPLPDASAVVVPVPSSKA